MAVRNVYGNGQYDPAVIPRVPLPAERTQGTVKSLKSTAALLSTDNATSTVNFGRIPRDAYISRKSDLMAVAQAGLTSVSLGFANAAAALISAVDAHSGGVFNLTAPAYADFATKPAWVLAGYTDENSCPAELDVIATIGADVSAPGALTLDLYYATTH